MLADACPRRPYSVYCVARGEQFLVQVVLWGNLILSVDLAFCSCATIFPPRKKVFLKKHIIMSALKVRKDAYSREPTADAWPNRGHQ